MAQSVRVSWAKLQKPYRSNGRTWKISQSEPIRIGTLVVRMATILIWHVAARPQPACHLKRTDMKSDLSKRRQFLASLGCVGLGLLIAAPSAMAAEEEGDEISANEERIARIEAEFGLADLTALTAPPPPADATP